ncbi:hypothetical protein FOVG_16560 [Fusarium oxysporum f. sp. pisi HDV247]|uniref:Uncharacterized protein n=1 Tax=Fusarium oxysporum f. sp. pisi HDV247 TaxID=1080344 RepID=W9NHD4_FUSOX|nr:hypothetical protein FOVG_16560 [Fusarium oxysporum f. sp. pisi HDV247]
MYPPTRILAVFPGSPAAYERVRYCPVHMESGTPSSMSQARSFSPFETSWDEKGLSDEKALPDEKPTGAGS